LKNQNNQKKALKVVCDSKILDDFIEQLPFKLTEDQNEAVDDFIGDFKRSYPMNRLVQGDVGSGKTVVALLAAHLAIKSGFKTAYLAPTQILARQHFETARKLMPNNTEILLLTATSRSKDINERIKKADLVIGTHALIQKDIKIDNLALVIVDEQHRFGVDQREYLLKTGRVAPHLLSLSATPIPRTLAHIIFGNLDVSTIFEKPSGRLEVKTYLIPENKRADSYRFIEKLISTGQQAFVVCPLIEQKSGSADGRLFDVLDRKAVESEMRNLQKTVLAKRKIESLHGRMKGEDKEEKMQRMQNGAIDIMVSTSVVEVGVDVPNATIMVVEGAQHFGLSQLHQFRGRVGRNKMQSYCFLFTDENLNDKTKERLKVFVQNSDGFKLSEMDLRQRGPGAVLGVDQSGFVGINPLWFENTEVLRKASKLAGDLVQDLENMPDLFSKVKEKLETKHLE
jgi:ATP-dependent DNA helicase RecG